MKIIIALIFTLFIISNAFAGNTVNSLIGNKGSIFNQALFKKIDTNSDGFLSQSEISNFKTEHLQGDLKTFDNVDTNNDKQISLLEFLVKGKMLFKVTPTTTK